MFPAHAGMSRLYRDEACLSYDVPRTRGDEPLRSEYKSSKAQCSPHTRG